MGKLPKSNAAGKSRTEDTSYERNYDLPKRAFSKELASEIERASWDTTERLVEAFEEAAAPTQEVAPPVQEEKEEEGKDGKGSDDRGSGRT